MAAAWLPHTAHAQAEPEKPAAAQAAFDRAVELAKTGKTCDAAAAFGESFRLHRARDTLNGLALSEEECGNHLSAYEHFATLLELAKTANDERRVEAATAGMDRTRAKIATVRIVAPAGATVSIDGKPIDDIAGLVPLLPGQHEITAEGTDGTFEEEVDVGAGETKEIEVSLTSASPVGDLGTLEVIGIAAGSVGVLGIISGAVLYASAGSAFDELQDQCPDNRCPSELAEQIEAGESEEVAGQALLGIGTVLLLAGAGLFTYGLLSDDEGGISTSVQLTPGGLVLNGRF